MGRFPFSGAGEFLFLGMGVSLLWCLEVYIVFIAFWEFLMVAEIILLIVMRVSLV
jgi:hypothetical protein